MKYILYWALEGAGSYVCSEVFNNYDEAYEGQQNLLEDFRDYPDAEVWIEEYE